MAKKSVPETVVEEDEEDENYPLVYKIIINGGTFNFEFQTGSQVIVQTGHPVPFPKG